LSNFRASRRLVSRSRRRSRLDQPANSRCERETSHLLPARRDRDGTPHGLITDSNSTADANERNALRDKAHTRTLIGASLAIGGGALLITGVIKLAIHPTSSPARLTIAASPTGIEVLGVF
jgi:hypothetical protein